MRRRSRRSKSRTDLQTGMIAFGLEDVRVLDMQQVHKCIRQWTSVSICGNMDPSWVKHEKMLKKFNAEIHKCIRPWTSVNICGNMDPSWVKYEKMLKKFHTEKAVFAQ